MYCGASVRVLREYLPRKSEDDRDEKEGLYTSTTSVLSSVDVGEQKEVLKEQYAKGQYQVHEVDIDLRISSIAVTRTRLLSVDRFTYIS